MIRSMFSAISGLRNHQTMMDVVGNNIANVNTTGFKSSGVVFQDILSQTLYGAGAPGAGVGGTNPAQVGLGSRLAAVTTNFSQGALQRTGRSTDFAIQGDGFFVVQSDGQQLYTRAGAFSVDANGNLVTQEGGLIQGWQADAGGNVTVNGPIGNLSIPVGGLLAPNPTSSVTLGGNLPGASTIGDAVATSVDVYDNQGAAIRLTITFTKSAANEWTATASYGTPATTVALTDDVLTFDGTGELSLPVDRDINIAAGLIPNVGAVSISLGGADDPGRISQYGSASTLATLAQDGFAAGSLQGFSVSREGLLVGTYSNGLTRALGQLALASFNNPEGLEKVGGSNFRASQNSGLAQVGVPGSGGRGQLVVGAVEMSNVDLAAEFTNLILAQRGFQANSRVITSSDEMLQEIVNLKR